MGNFFLLILSSKYLNDKPTIRPTDIQYKLRLSCNFESIKHIHNFSVWES